MNSRPAPPPSSPAEIPQGNLGGQETSAENSGGQAESATSTEESTPAAPPRIELSGQKEFAYDISLGKTPCGDKIGTVQIVSSDPAKELYWGMTGAKPIWLSFSEVEGKTPAEIDMTFNCIMSGAEDTIDWKFVVVEKTKEGKWVDGYYRSFSLKGDIR